MKTKIALFNLSQQYAEFSQYVAKYLGCHIGKCAVEHFKDGAMNLQLDESVRGADVFVLQPYTRPLGEREKELYYFLHAAKHGGSAARITVVQPYCFEQRSDGPDRPRDAIGALIVARNLKANGADGSVVVDAHSKAVGGFYASVGMQFESLKFSYLAANYIIQKAKDFGNVVIAAPDAGAAKRSRDLGALVEEKGGFPVRGAMIDKERTKADTTKAHGVMGEVKDAAVFMADDIGDTLGTIVKAARAMRDKGAKNIYAVLTHPVLGDGYEKNLEEALDKGLIDEMVFGNTIPLKEYAAKHPKVKSIALEPFVAEAIRRIHENTSLSALHEYDTIINLYEGQGPKNDPKIVPVASVRRS